MQGSRPLPVSSYLIAHTAPDDRIFGDNFERVLMETGRRSGSRFATLFHWVNYDTAPLEYGRTLMSDLEREPPKYIVLRTDLARHIEQQMVELSCLAERPVRRANYVQAWEELRAYVERNYAPEAVVDEFTVFRRRETSSAAEDG